MAPTAAVLALFPHYSRHNAQSIHQVYGNNQFLTIFPIISVIALCSLWGCKNKPASFPGRMSYKATKPGSVCHVS